MSDNVNQIRELIENWAGAVHRGDLDAVLTDHSDDIVMFDVPPPEDGVRGITAYRDTWPPFFSWQQHGASFEIVSLDVTAGEDVALAYALLRCGTSEELVRDPSNRLRLTVGLRRDGERWVVTHASLVPRQDLTRFLQPVESPGGTGSLSERLTLRATKRAHR